MWKDFDADTKDSIIDDNDNKLLYNGTHMMQFNTIPVEYFTDPEKFIDALKTDKGEFLKKHLMISQLMACRQQDKLDGIEDENLKRERADRVMIAKGKEFYPDLYLFIPISDEYPKMYILAFPPELQAPALCKRMYFLIGENSRAALYTIETSENKPFLCEITEKRTHINYGEIKDDSVFEDTKRVLELFIAKNNTEEKYAL